jgi:TadE-like protein
MLTPPWLVFLFVGILDLGFYFYASICTQEAARVAAIQYASQGADPCQAALGELNGLPNMIGVTTCAASKAAITTSLPASVVYQTLSHSTTPACADCAVDTTATSEQVTVTYQSVPMVPIPGILMGQMTLSRTAEARIIVP